MTSERMDAMGETGQRPACDCPRPSGQHDAACAKYGKAKALVETNDVKEPFSKEALDLFGKLCAVDGIGSGPKVRVMHNFLKEHDAAIAHAARVGVLSFSLALVSSLFRRLMNHSRYRMGML